MKQPHSFHVQHVQSRHDDLMSDAVVATPLMEMVGRKAGSSPVSVASHPSSVNAECAPALSPSRRDAVLKTACQNAYGKSVIKERNDALEETEQSSLAVVMHPIVVVGEDGGAEVTLDHREQPESLETPMKEAPYGRDIAALLDVDISPSPMATKTRSLDSIMDTRTAATSPSRRPSPIDIPDVAPSSPKGPSKSPKSPFGPKLCCGTGCWPSDDGDTALIPANQASIEETICGLLGTSAGMDDYCDGWQAFSYFTLGSNQQGTLHLKQDIRQVLRNRACNMNARSRRIKELRKNLRPFDEHHVEHAGKDTIPITKTQSFCTSDHASSKARQTRKYSKAHSDISGSAASMGSTMWAVVSCNSGSHSDSPAAVPSRNSEEDDLCYDSDPEETTHRHAREGVRKKAVSSFLRSGAWEDQFSSDKEFPFDEDNEKSDSLQPKRLDFDVRDDLSVKDVVKAFMNKRMTLIWHRGGDSADEVHGPPLAVKAWIEHGHRLRSTLIQPKLMWKPVNESDEQKASLGISSQNLHSIDLLDVLRILEVNRVDQRRYALAKRTNSLLVESLDETVLFEASSEAERDHIVYGLKLVVARLGSKVVVGDEDMFEEFFGFVPVGGLEDNEPAVW